MSATPLTEREEYPQPPDNKRARGTQAYLAAEYFNEGWLECLEAVRAARASALLPPVGGVQDSPNTHLAATPNAGGAEWIPVTARLPEIGMAVLVWRENRFGNVSQDCLQDDSEDGLYWSELGDLAVGDFVTHWMPLPAAPTDSASSIRSDRQEAVPNKTACGFAGCPHGAECVHAVPASSPVAPQAEPVALARRFHEAYERLAPTFGYTTRLGTRKFEPESDNGKLMIAVCAEIFAAPQGDGLLRQWEDAYAAFMGAFDTPQQRRIMTDDYSADARSRLREFDFALRQYLPKDPA